MVDNKLTTPVISKVHWKLSFCIVQYWSVLASYLAAKGKYVLGLETGDGEIYDRFSRNRT